MTLHVYTELIQGSEEWLEARRGIITVPLTRGLHAIVDADAAEVVGDFKWHAVASHETFYACRRVGPSVLRLHTELTGWPLVDHINGNGLDNRRANLRPATYSENARNRKRARNNTSGFKGVSWNRRLERWAAYITVDKHRRHLGYYPTARDAALAYDAAAVSLHGDFARLNFPGGSR